MQKINVFSPCCYTGYGVAGFNITTALIEQGVDVSLFPIGPAIAINPQKLKIVQNAYEQHIKYDYKAPCLKIWHAWDLSSRIGSGLYYVFPFFELDSLSEIEQHNLNSCDHIFVASKWAKTILDKYKIKTKTTVIPLGVDTDIFDYRLCENVESKPTKYIFSVIGKWEIRKGHDILLDIFEKAFPNNEEVELWVNASSDNGYISKEEKEQWENMYQNHKMKDKIKLFSPLNTHHDMAKLLSYIDCGLYISRAEGWNLELLETMAMGKPTIATNYSAHTEFCTTDNCYLIDIDETESAHDGKYFKGQGNWAKIDNKQIDQIIDHMRYVYKNNIKTNDAGIKTAKEFSWKNSAKCIIDIGV
jgi:glycosyltransferase involved in cell wall biosynthesis